MTVQDAAFGTPDEIQKFLHFRKLRELGFGLSDRIFHVQNVPEENVIQLLDRMDGLSGKTVAAQTDDVESADAAVAAVADHERRQVH